MRISLLWVLLLCLALLAAGAGAATRGVPVTTTPPVDIPRVITTVTPTPTPTTVSCTAPCSCMERSAAVAAYGADGFTQCADVPCAYTRDATGAPVTKYCFQQKLLSSILPATTETYLVSQIPACSNGLTFCAGTGCTNTATDTGNCGSCGHTCPVAYTCTGGQCTVPVKEMVTADACMVQGKASCGGTCIDIHGSDSNNCGGCGWKCPSGLSCYQGECEKDCPLGWIDCQYTCYDPNNNREHCGSCQNSCSQGESCCKGTCGSFQINSVYPIQVMDAWGHPLVEGKGTVFKAVISSTYECDKQVNFTLTLPEDQWGTTGWKSGLFPRQPIPAEFGPVTIPAKANGFAVYLPYIPYGKRNETASLLNDNNLGKIARFPITATPGPGLSGIAKQIRPDFRIMPVPIKTASGKASYQVTLRPVNDPGVNNPAYTYHASADVIVTRPWRFLLVHEKFTSLASNPPLTDPGEKASLARILATQPIADDAITATVMPSIGTTACEPVLNPGDVCPYSYDHDVVPGEPEYVSYVRYAYLAETAAKWGYNVGVGISPWGGQYNPNTKSMTVNPDYRYWMFAHEFTHFAVPMGDVPFYMQNCTRFSPNTDGFWVNAYEPINDKPYYMDGPSGDNWIIGTSTKTLNLANPACMYDINFYYGQEQNLGGMDSDGYYHLLSSPTFFVKDPEGLLVSGVVYRNGTAKLSPFSYLPATILDVQPGSRGAYTFVLSDAGGRQLSSSGFDLSFQDLRPDNPKDTTIPRARDYAPFVRIIEWKAGTQRIDLKDSTGRVIATRAVSPNPPTVKILAPDGGETWTLGEPVTIKWTGSDPDGDVLTYDIGISGDGGTTWIPLATNLARTEFTLKPGGLYGGDQYRIKVMASDGVNVGETVSAANFRVNDPNSSPLSLPVIIGGAIMVLLIMAGAGWFLLKKRGRT